MDEQIETVIAVGLVVVGIINLLTQREFLARVRKSHRTLVGEPHPVQDQLNRGIFLIVAVAFIIVGVLALVGVVDLSRG